MSRKFSKIIFMVTSALIVILIYGVNTYPYVLSMRTIKNLEVNDAIWDYGYRLDFKFAILHAEIEITNMGPLDATLHDANITISFNNGSGVTIPVENTVELPAGGSYNYTIAPPELEVEDESRAILEKMMEQRGHVDYLVTLKAHASCGVYEGPIEKTFSGSVVFTHPPPYINPLLLHHGVFTDMGVNQTYVVSYSRLMLPWSFRVGRLGDTWINREHYWGLSMYQQEKIRFSFNATEPIHFQLVLSDNPDLNSWGIEKVFIDIPSTSSFSTNFTAPKEGLYVFVFRISQPDSVATVIFDGVSFWP